MNNSAVHWAAVAAACVVIACAERSPADYLQSAEQHLARSDWASAEVELRNAVRLAPQSGPAIRLLGIARGNLGFAAPSEAALRRAIELGEPLDAVLPSLAKALAEQGKGDALLREFGDQPRLRDDRAEATFRSYLADALLAGRDVARASETYRAALAAHADHAPALVGQARILGLEGRTGDALVAVEQVLAAAPQLGPAHRLKAELLLMRGDRASARQSLERALEATPGEPALRLALVALLVDDKQYDRAQALLNVPAAQKDARLVYLKSLVALRQGTLDKAREHLAPLMKATPVPPFALTLAGEIELRAGNPALAEGHLRAALAAATGDTAARKLLAATYLRQGQPSKAIDTLQPLLAAAPNDAPLAALAGEAYLAHGDLERASEVFEVARAGEKSNPQALLRLGQIALARGDIDQGVGALQAAAAIEGSTRADLALIGFHLRRQEHDKALAAAEAYRKKAPQDLLAHHAAGMVSLSRKEFQSARASFVAATALKGDFLPALRGLAEVDLAEGKPADAERRYDALLAKAPEERTFLALADVQRRLPGGAEAASVTLRNALAKFPRSVPLNSALVQQHLRKSEFDAALGVARKAADAAPEPGLIGLLGETQLATGDIQGASRTYERLATIDSQSPRPLQRLAAIHLKQKDYARAAEALKGAQYRAPDDGAIVGELVGVYLADGKLDRAASAAQALAARSTGSALGQTLLGDVYRAQKKPAEAERAYRAALEADPRRTASAIGLCELLAESGRAARCQELGAEWLARHPGDIAMRMFVADRALAAKRLPDAVRQYEAVLGQDPAHVAAHNNLAWVLGELNDPRAIGIAQRAAQLAPYSADVLNTLGVVQVRRGEADQGLKHLARARALAPHRPDLRLDHAKGLLKAGRIDEGKAELLALASEPGDFRGKSEVAQLLDALPRKAVR